MSQIIFGSVVALALVLGMMAITVTVVQTLAVPSCWQPGMARNIGAAELGCE